MLNMYDVCKDVHWLFMDLKYWCQSLKINKPLTLKYAFKLNKRIKYVSYLPTQPLLAWVAGGATNSI